MIDLLQYATTQFYAGRPDVVTAVELAWKGHDYSMWVREENGVLTATMGSGNCEWKVPIDPKNFVESVDAALEDACDLGRIANWSSDE